MEKEEQKARAGAASSLFVCALYALRVGGLSFNSPLTVLLVMSVSHGLRV